MKQQIMVRWFIIASLVVIASLMVIVSSNNIVSALMNVLSTIAIALVSVVIILWFVRKSHYNDKL